MIEQGRKDTLNEALEDFADTKERNTWIYRNDFKLYLRKSFRMGNAFLDIANVTVYEPGKGLFTRVCADVIEVAERKGFAGVYVECVTTPRFQEYFRKRNWWERTDPGAPSFYFLFDS